MTSLPPPKELEFFATQAESAVLAAAKKILVHITSGSGINAHLKSDKTFVTDLDLLSQDVMFGALKLHAPVASEEEESSYANLQKKGFVFVADPLDGTSACMRYRNEPAGQVGFGPMVGTLYDGKVVAVSFFDIPSKSLYSARRHLGCRVVLNADECNELAAWNARKELRVQKAPALSESAVLFFAGVRGELSFVEKLRKKVTLENVLRFGGFANDCSRLARGLENLQIQFTVKAFDLPAALLIEEAGLSVLLDPLGKPTVLADWIIAEQNPLISGDEERIREILFTVA